MRSKVLVEASQKHLIAFLFMLPTPQFTVRFQVRGRQRRCARTSTRGVLVARDQQLGSKTHSQVV